MLRGLTTISLWADDLPAAKAWYAELLGLEPYFEVAPQGEPAYYEFRLGDYQHELGIISTRYAPQGSGAGLAGPRVYWHVDDVTETLARLNAMGAGTYEEPVDRGEGYITASVVDPFGNVLGVMYNPHYLEMLGRLHKDDHPT